jgi:hypothetical protein
MEPKPQTSQEYFRTLKIIFFALILGQVFFALVSYLLNKDMAMTVLEKELINVLKYLLPVFILGGYLSSKLMFSKNLKTAISRQTLSEKLTDYRTALIIRFALLEGASFITTLVYLLTGNAIFLGFAVIVIVIFLTMMPSAARAVKDLQLNVYDEQKISNPDAVIE